MDLNRHRFEKQMVLDSIMVCLAIDKLKTDNNEGWIGLPRAAFEFYAQLVDLKTGPQPERPNRFRNARENAVFYGWVEHGHRSGTETKVVEAGSSASMSRNDSFKSLSNEDKKDSEQAPMAWEDYLRLGHSGEELVERNKKPDGSPADMCNSNPRVIFIKNIPGHVSMGDLADYLESAHGCNITAAQQKRFSSAFWLAHAKTESALDAETLLLLSKKSKLELHGRRLQVSQHNNPTLQLKPIERNEDSSERMVLSDITGTTSGTTTSAGMPPNEHRPLIRFVEGDLEETQQTSVKRKRDAKPHRLFVKNISKTVSILGLVRYLEKEVKCSILKARKEEGPHWYTSRSYYFARVEVESEEDAKALVARSNKLHLDGRVLEISLEKFPRTKLTGDATQSPATYYEKVPTTSPLDVQVSDLTRLLCICLLQLSSEKNFEWQNSALLGEIFKVELVGGESTKDSKCLMAPPTTKEFRDAYNEAWRKNLMEIGRHKLLDGKRKSPNISVVPEGSKNDGTWYGMRMYFRFTTDGQRFTRGLISSSAVAGATDPKTSDDRLQNESTMLLRCNDGLTSSNDNKKREAVISPRGEGLEEYCHRREKDFGMHLNYPPRYNDGYQRINGEVIISDHGREEQKGGDHYVDYPPHAKRGGSDLEEWHDKQQRRFVTRPNFLTAVHPQDIPTSTYMFASPQDLDARGRTPREKLLELAVVLLLIMIVVMIIINGWERK